MKHRMAAGLVLMMAAVGSTLWTAEPGKAETPLPKVPRILLFSSAPTREYQFTRTLFVREYEKERADLRIYIQPPPGEDKPRVGVVQDLEDRRLLKEFPKALQDPKKDDKDNVADNLNNYDLIVAFDPDWNRLSDDQLAHVNQWVKAGGALIVSAGPINTHQLVRKGKIRENLELIAALYPVNLLDSRLHDAPGAATVRRLNFPKAADVDFLKLRNESPSAVIDWEEFFTGETDLQKGQQAAVQRGFYTCYPVESIKETTRVLATFADPKVRLKDGSEPPYLAVMPYGKGRVVWVGSGETWRLRQFRETYHERFWLQLAEYAVKK